MIDKEGEIEIGDLEDGVEYVKTDDSSTSGDDSAVQTTIQNTQSELHELLSDGEVIDTDNVDYSSDEYYESIKSEQAEAYSSQQAKAEELTEILNSDDTINTNDVETDSNDFDDDEDE